VTTISKATVTWDSIKVGDKLPPMQKSETQEDIDNYTKLNEHPASGGGIPGFNLHSDTDIEGGGIFKGTVNYGVVTVAFMTELLQNAFPARAVTRGTISMRALEPIRPLDLVTYAGEVVGKRTEGDKRLVDVELNGKNQLDQTVAVAKATVVL
jgi:hypothetical protein